MKQIFNGTVQMIAHGTTDLGTELKVLRQS